MKRWILRRMFERTDVRCYFPKLPRLFPLPFRRGEGWGEGLLGVVYPAVLAVRSPYTRVNGECFQPKFDG